MRLPRTLIALTMAALLGGFPCAGSAQDGVPDPKSAKEANDPLPPVAMPESGKPYGAPSPRGTPEGMGNEVDLTRTPGDDDPSDGIDEPGRAPIPGLPRPAPGVNKP